MLGGQCDTAASQQDAVGEEATRDEDKTCFEKRRSYSWRIPQTELIEEKLGALKIRQVTSGIQRAGSCERHEKTPLHRCRAIARCAVSRRK